MMRWFALLMVFTALMGCSTQSAQILFYNNAEQHVGTAKIQVPKDLTEIDSFHGKFVTKPSTFLSELPDHFWCEVGDGGKALDICFFPQVSDLDFCINMWKSRGIYKGTWSRTNLIGTEVQGTVIMQK